MTNADYWTGWVVDATSAVVLLDTWSPNYDQPNKDAQQGGSDDLDNISGSQTATSTTISFRRKLVTGDKATDIDITDEDLYIMYGLCPTDGTGTASGTASVHYEKHNVVGAGIVIS